MNSSVDKFMSDMECENNQMHDSLREKEAENRYLLEKISLLEKALEKEKKFHRKYAEEVVDTEAIRIADFKKETQSYIVENKTLKKINSQLVKDVRFYKMAHEELANNESVVATAGNSPRKSPIQTTETESQTVVKRLRPSIGKHKSSKEAIKINLSLFEENKKLQSKISDIKSTVAVLTKKNKQLENFRNKIENKKLNFAVMLRNWSGCLIYQKRRTGTRSLQKSLICWEIMRKIRV